MIRTTSIRLRLHFSSPFRFSTSAVASPLSDAVFPSSAGAPLTQESVLYVLNKLDRKPQQALSFFRSVTDQHRFAPGPPAYNLMLRILCYPDHLTDFWAFLKSMRDAGHAIDQGTYLTLLANFKKHKLPHEPNALSKYYRRTAKEAASEASVSAAATAILESENWNDEEGKKLDLIFSEATVSKVLREVRDRPEKALDFFRLAERRSDYEHGSVAYNALIRVMAREESMGQFWSLIQEMKDKGHELDIDTYVKVSRHFIKHKMMNAAVELYELMMDGPYKPAIQDCGILLRQIALSGAPDLDLVHRVVRKYEASGYSLSKVVYDGIHRSLTTIGKFDDANEILERMKLDGYEPDNITYSQLVFGLCKAKRLDDARNVLDVMEIAGCIPDVKTWTILIQGHCNAGEVEKAQELFAKMIEKNCEADGDVLDVMVRGLCSKNMADAGYRLFYEMVERAHMKPWQETYKFLIQQLLRSGMLEEALKLLRSMMVHRFPPYSAPFPFYISRHGTIEDAKEFLKALTMNNYPSPMVYLQVFQSLFEEGRYSEAQDILFKCPHHVRKHSDISKLFGSIKTEKAS
ncbi:pentatricopeptide repeat-containing protein At3g48250, chloroplastic-like [Zingiber officinale]|uniref:pentatricopeptide repeat-containing protein At3g48250, chloroplastic-like n=1 Tax=Zingiber officinale TaxID=94328 RepID=UPI001C4BD0AC|nr:pentatricopeptide repeat-containing protein At3g48250, chloroplastic-like [Zingiber officinale]